MTASTPRSAAGRVAPPASFPTAHSRLAGLGLVATLALPLAGCTLSNAIFEEDMLFVAALPDEADLYTEHPASRDDDGALVDEERDVGDEATMPPIARLIAVQLNEAAFGFLVSVDRAMEGEITGRTRDSRTWGPYPHGPSGGSARLVVSRGERDARFFEYAVAFSFDAPDEVDDATAWTDVAAGQFARDSENLREGSGSFCWDADAFSQFEPDAWGSGSMCVEHRRVGPRIRLHVEQLDWLRGDGERIDREYFFDHREDLGGVLEFVTREDMLGDPATGEQETLSVRVRWMRGHAGRADFVVTGGDLGALDVPGTECWGPGLRRTFLLIDPPGTADDVLEGGESACVFEQREEVREIR